MSNYDLVIFDLDGTVLRTDEAIAYCTLQTLREVLPGEMPGIELEIQKLIATGNTLDDTFSRLGVRDDLISQCVARYREIYSVESDDLCSLFDGVHETFEKLARASVKVALLSNKGDVALRAAVRSFKLEAYLDFAVGERNGVKPKPDPSVFHAEILPFFGLKRTDRFLMVGDTAPDIKFAHAINGDSCWVKYGFGLPEICEPLQPTFAVEKMTDVIGITVGRPRNKEFTCSKVRRNHGTSEAPW